MQKNVHSKKKKKRFYQRYIFGTLKRFYTEAFLRVLVRVLSNQGNGSIWNLLGSFQIKYFILLTNIKTLKCIYECMRMITKFKIWGLENVYIYIILCSSSISHEVCHFSCSPPKISMIKM